MDNPLGDLGVDVGLGTEAIVVDVALVVLELIWLVVVLELVAEAPSVTASTISARVQQHLVSWYPQRRFNDVGVPSRGVILRCKSRPSPAIKLTCQRRGSQTLQKPPIPTRSGNSHPQKERYI